MKFFETHELMIEQALKAHAKKKPGIKKRNAKFTCTSCGVKESKAWRGVRKGPVICINCYDKRRGMNGKA